MKNLSLCFGHDWASIFHRVPKQPVDLLRNYVPIFVEQPRFLLWASIMHSASRGSSVIYEIKLLSNLVVTVICGRADSAS